MEERQHLLVWLFGDENFQAFRAVFNEEMMAFGFGVPFLIAFAWINRSFFSSVKNGFVYCVAIYMASVLTGVLVSEGTPLDGRYESAFIAGVVAPVFYAVLVSIYFRRAYIVGKKKERDEFVDLSDHLIQK